MSYDCDDDGDDGEGGFSELAIRAASGGNLWVVVIAQGEQPEGQPG